jgi:protease IV
MKSFFGSFFGTIIAVVLMVFFGFVGGIGIFTWIASQQKKPNTPNHGLLVIDLSTPINDAPPTFDPGQVVSTIVGDKPETITLNNVLTGIRRAAEDNQIDGIFLTGTIALDPYSSSYAALKEVRQALVEFKKTKKPVYAYELVGNTRTVYLDSVADKIYLDPQEAMGLQGLSMQPLYFGDALKRFGIGMQVTRVGKYKSAVEPYLMNQMSPEAKQENQELLNQIWAEVTRTIEQARGMRPGKIQELITQMGVIDPDTALQSKLVTDVKSLNEVVDQFCKQYGRTGKEQSFPQMDLRDYIDLDATKNAPTGARVAVVYAEGEIVDGEGKLGYVGGNKLARTLHKVSFDPDVKAVVLRVNSPGGSVVASEVIRRALAEARSQHKQVIVSMGGMAASGGYWISTAANRIFAEPNTITGSIGVFGLFPNFQKIANDHGITWDSVETAPFASLFSTTRPRTDAELAVIQKYIDKIYQQFIHQVATTRHMPEPEVNEIAQGRVWSGEEALKLKLIDETGGFNDAIAYAGNAVGLGPKPVVEEFPKRMSLNDKLKQIFNDEPRTPVMKLDPVNRELVKLREALESFRMLNDPQNVYALEFYRVL